ncbi:MAG TPA: hypothetical protein VI756_05040 [Blastocatellia bacterium]
MENVPSAQTRPQSANEWKGEFELPEAVIAYYEEVGPVDVRIESVGNPWFLPSLAGLWEFQGGYRFYGLSGERLDDWNDDWLVIADEGGDPFILSRATGEVSFDMHGQGNWKPVPIFDDLAVMISSFAVLGGIVIREGANLFDENSEVRTTFLNEALERISEIVGPPASAAEILTLLGWTDGE